MKTYERIKNKKQLRKYRSIVSSKVSNTDTTNETFDQFVLGIQRNNGFKVSNANLYQDTLDFLDEMKESRRLWLRLLAVLAGLDMQTHLS